MHYGVRTSTDDASGNMDTITMYLKSTATTTTTTTTHTCHNHMELWHLTCVRAQCDCVNNTRSCVKVRV